MWLHVSAAHTAIIRPALKHNMFLNVPTIWDPLCLHVLVYVATRDLTFYLLTIKVVVSGRKYTYVLYCHTTGWHPLNIYFLLVCF